jgi:lipopolysaccharide export system permease protein
MMIAPLAGGILIAVLLTLFYNHVYPYANHNARILRYDVARKKPALTIVPGIFSQEVTNYSILVRGIDEEKNELKKLTIYDNSNPRNTAIITAEKGKLRFSKKNDQLIMTLWYGEIHSTSIIDRENYRKMKFEKHKIVMDASQFSFRESKLSGRKTERELGAQVMVKIVDSLKTLRANYTEDLENKISKEIFRDSVSIGEVQSKSKSTYRNILRRVDDKLSTAKSAISSTVKRIDRNIESANSYLVEINKHYAIPFACIVFILIGAPLGTMTRKSGIGVAAAISLVFFLVYWAFLIGGEKLADRGLITPFWGMWSANIVLTILGIYLTIKSARERITIEFDFLLKFIPRQFRIVRENDQDTR